MEILEIAPYTRVQMQYRDLHKVLAQVLRGNFFPLFFKFFLFLASRKAPLWQTEYNSKRQSNKCLQYVNNSQKCKRHLFFLNGKIIKCISLFTFRNWYKFNTCSYNNIIAHQYCHHVFILEIEGVLELDCPRYKYKRRKRNILTLLKFCRCACGLSDIPH